MTALGGGPALLLLDRLGLETPSLPSAAALPGVVVEVLLATITTPAYFATLRYGGPEFTAMALTLMIPVSSGVDYVIHGVAPGPLQLLGGLCIAAANCCWAGGRAGSARVESEEEATEGGYRRLAGGDEPAGFDARRA